MIVSLFLMACERYGSKDGSKERYGSANSLVVSVVGLELYIAFMWFEFDSRRFKQLFGTPVSKVSLR